jgi:hypothetical protein
LGKRGKSLGVYDQFVNTVQTNKDKYSREDWDEIKLMYEALDSRKNTKKRRVCHLRITENCWFEIEICLCIH